MENKDRKSFLILLLFNKKTLLLNEGVNVSLNDLLDYMANFHFRNENPTYRKILEFLLDTNNKKIIDYLFTQAIIKPKF